VTTSIAPVRRRGRAASHLHLIHLAALLSATTHGLPGTPYRGEPFAFVHLETATKPLKLLERVLTDFSKCGLKSLDNQADFDSAIRRFESSRPSQCY
jgi:hypothetical protein